MKNAKNIVERYRELLESQTQIIVSRQGFFQHLLILPKYNIDSDVSDVDFWTLWSDSILQLDPDTSKRFFHHIKLDIERKAEDECHAFGAFERLRLKPEMIQNLLLLKGIVRIVVFIHRQHSIFMAICKW
jgi:hypothetical protein